MAPIAVDNLENLQTYEYSTNSLINDPTKPGIYKLTTQSKLDNLSTATCIRKVANWSKVTPKNKFDLASYSPEITAQMMNVSSPKMTELFKNIERLDADDMAKYGHKFKHYIYTDVKGVNGAKIIGAGFISHGYNLVYNDMLKLKPVNELKNNGKIGNNFGLLCSSTIFKKSIGVKFKKTLLEMYNKRPSNIHGDDMRFMILDSGFKEGIDLFDVKYVHLFEPLVSMADQKQAIGRGTRFCGQKGIEFHPTLGWALNVFIYDVSYISKHKPSTLFKMYMEESGIDIRLLHFASAIEELTIIGAVDRELTRKIHSFTIMNEDILEKDISLGLNTLFKGGSISKSISAPASISYEKLMSEITKSPFVLNAKNVITPTNITNQTAPNKIMTFVEMRKFITANYSKYAWDNVVMKNGCVPNGGLPTQSKTGNIVEFSKTQDFVRNYFNSESVYKGMLLFHSVGTGKTCSAVATASSSYEERGYTILYVTRHTLKSDMWKNMFGQVCNVILKDKIEKGLVLPQDVKQPSKFISKGWLAPISFKTLTNMLLGKNQLYKDIVKINGSDDVLKKTLIIIDEAHKIFDPNVPKIEKPDINILSSMIHKSYKLSGKDSVRILAMTATPYTTDPMDLIRILNLLRPEETVIPSNFEAFSKIYLDKDGQFTKDGKMKYLNDISGYISYLNREKDARQFSYPVIKDIIVPISKQSHDINQVKETLLEEFYLEKESELESLQNKLNSDLEACKQITDKTEKKECIKEARLNLKENKKQLSLKMKNNKSKLLKEFKEKTALISQEEAIEDCKSGKNLIQMNIFKKSFQVEASLV